MIPTWLKELNQVVLCYSSGGTKALSATDRGLVRDECTKHSRDISEVISSPVLAPEEFLQLFVRTLSGYAASVNSDILLPDANDLYNEFRPTQWESQLVYRALRYERKSDFPPTLRNIRDALSKARGQSATFALVLKNIFRMMDGTPMLAAYVADEPMSELSYAGPLQLEYQEKEFDL